MRLAHHSGATVGGCGARPASTVSRPQLQGETHVAVSRSIIQGSAAAANSLLLLGLLQAAVTAPLSSDEQLEMMMQQHHNSSSNLQQCR
jgi:hypothetical protein